MNEQNFKVTIFTRANAGDNPIGWSVGADTVEEAKAMAQELQTTYPSVTPQDIQVMDNAVTNTPINPNEGLTFGDEKKLCPACKKEMKLRDGKYGQFWGCTGYPECKEIINVK